jgi:hypothetical protein
MTTNKVGPRHPDLVAAPGQIAASQTDGVVGPSERPKPYVLQPIVQTHAQAVTPLLIRRLQAKIGAEPARLGASASAGHAHTPTHSLYGGQLGIGFKPECELVHCIAQLIPKPAHPGKIRAGGRNRRKIGIAIVQGDDRFTPLDDDLAVQTDSAWRARRLDAQQARIFRVDVDDAIGAAQKQVEAADDHTRQRYGRRSVARLASHSKFCADSGGRRDRSFHRSLLGTQRHQRMRRA